MDVRCEKCSTEYELDESKLKPSGVTVKCTNCGHMFKVRKRRGAESGAPSLSNRTWLVRLTSGETKACYELSTLQQWIAAGHVGPECQISRTGKKWKRLGDLAELASFFDIAREAKSKRAPTVNTVRRRESSAELARDRLPKPETGSPAPANKLRSTIRGMPADRLPVGHDTDEVPTLDSEEVPTNKEEKRGSQASSLPVTKVAHSPVELMRQDTDEFETFPEDRLDTSPTLERKPTAAELAQLTRNSKKKPPSPSRPTPSRPAPLADTAPVPSMELPSEKDARPGTWTGGPNPKSGPSGPTGGLAKGIPTDEAAFVSEGFKPFDTGEDKRRRPRRAGIGAGIVVGAVLVMVAAGVFVYLTVLRARGDEPVAIPMVSVDAAVAPAPVDAAPEPPETLALEEARAALFKDTPEALELAAEKLDSVPDAQVGEESSLLVAQIALAQLDHLAMEAWRSEPAAARKLQRTVKNRLRAVQNLVDKARQMAPGSAATHVVKADYARLSKRPSREVERSIRKALAQNKDHRGALLSRALLNLRERRHRDARKVLEALLDDTVPDTRPRYYLAELDLAEKNMAAAKDGAEAVLAVEGEHGRARDLLVRIESAKKVVTSDPMPPEERTGPEKELGGSYESLVRRGDSAAETNNCGEAKRAYEKALDQNPAGVAALTGLGYCHLDARQFASAQAKFRAALGISPRYRDALFGVAEAYQQQGLGSRAIEAYRRYLDAHPSGRRAESARRQIARLGGSESPKKPDPAPSPEPTPSPQPAPDETPPADPTPENKAPEPDKEADTDKPADSSGTNGADKKPVESESTEAKPSTAKPDESSDDTESTP